MLLVVVIPLIIVAVGFLYLYKDTIRFVIFSKVIMPKNKKLPPVVHSPVPFLGEAISFGLKPLQYAQEKYSQYGEVFTTHILGSRITFLVGPNAAWQFFKGDESVLDQEEPYRFVKPVFGPGVVYDVPLETRIQQMAFVSKGLRTDMLKAHVPKIIEECEMYFAKWGNEGEVDFMDSFSELIILTASRALMGDEIRSRLHDQVSKLYHQLDEGLTSLSVFWPNAPIPAHKRRDQARLKMVELFSQVMAERRAHPEVKHDDVLQVFMDCEYKNGKKNTDEEVTGLMIALLFAGQHTSSISSAWTGCYLLRSPEILKRVRDEQDKVLSSTAGQINWDALGQMSLLELCIKEAIRMNPPLIFLMRKAVVDYVYNDYVIPAGDTLFVSPTINMSLPHIFAQPDKFDPDRFTEPRAEQKKGDFAYVGFGGGRHECMGQRFALAQIKTIWTILLRDFELEAIGPMPKPDYTAMVVGPSHPCKLRYKRRVPLAKK